MLLRIGKKRRKPSTVVREATGKVDVVRTLTLPNGKKIRVMRKDAFDRTVDQARGKTYA